MMAAVPNVSAMDTVVANSDNRNCFSELIPLPIFKLFGVCSLMFIFYFGCEGTKKKRAHQTMSPIFVVSLLGLHISTKANLTKSKNSYH
jgi:hypothetical protein